MRKALVLAVLCVTTAFAATTWAADFEELWLYASPNMQNPDQFIELLRKGKEAGVTHVLMGDTTPLRPENVTPEYLANVAKVKAALEELGIKNAMNVYPTGWGGRYFGLEPGVAAGLPARNMPFIVKDGSALPDPANVPAIANADFEAVTDGKLDGWTVEGPEDLVAVDTEVKHGGAASVRFGSLDGLDGGNSRVKQTLTVTPFQHYRLTMWVKCEGIVAEGEDYLTMMAPDGKRRYSYTGLRLRAPRGETGATQDWTRFSFVFNTLEATEIVFSVGASDARAGMLWMDDITVEPAGTLGVLRGPTKPLSITSADGKTVYEEGKDFAEITMPRPVERPRGPRLEGTDRAGARMESTDRARGGFDRERSDMPLPEIPSITIPEGSRIKNGDTILVSFFHPVVVYFGQVNASLEDPRYVELQEREVKGAQEVWQPHGFFMGYDEIRAGGWEIQPDGRQMTPGEILAENVKKGIAIIKKHAPEATIYSWSDMFTPLHNARPFSARNMYYYLVNGNWDGAWEGLPSDVVIMNWYGRSKESIEWFAKRGNKQVLCGYYDSPDLKANIRQWMEVSEGSEGVIGMMYTTWQRNFDLMPEFFKLVKEYPAWVEKAPEGPSGVNEK